ncbi:MAG: flagellar brake protein [Halanaerobacter sp.]
MRDGEKVSTFDLEENLEINQRVEFEIQNGKYEGRYPTQIVDIIGNNRFVVNAPFSKGRVIRVSTNARAQVFVRGKTALYSLPVQVVEKDFDSTHLFVLELKGQPHKIQERRYFRLEIYKSITFKLITDESDLEKFDNISPEDFLNGEDESEEVDQKELPGIVDDISAGGIKLVSQHRLKLNQLIDLDLDFIGAEFADVLGQVLRVDKIVKDHDKRYEMGVEFLGLDRSKRDDLMRWLFSKQRELRKKGLI